MRDEAHIEEKLDEFRELRREIEELDLGKVTFTRDSSSDFNEHPAAIESVRRPMPSLCMYCVFVICLPKYLLRYVLLEVVPLCVFM